MATLFFHLPPVSEALNKKPAQGEGCELPWLILDSFPVMQLETQAVMVLIKVLAHFVKITQAFKTIFISMVFLKYKTKSLSDSPNNAMPLKITFPAQSPVLWNSWVCRISP